MLLCHKGGSRAPDETRKYKVEWWKDFILLGGVHHVVNGGIVSLVFSKLATKSS